MKSAMSKRLTAEELRTDIERTMDTELRASYGPLYTTPSGALVRDVYREPIEKDEPKSSNDIDIKVGMEYSYVRSSSCWMLLQTANDGNSSSSKAKTTAELRAEAIETYKQRKAAYYEACPLSLDVNYRK